MPIFHKHKIIFVHIPKAAGTSICKYFGLPRVPANPEYTLQGKNDEGFWRQHFTLQEIREKAPELTDYRTVAFVRNPFDRVVSAFFWWRAKVSGRQFLTLDHFLDYSEKILSCGNFYNLGIHFRPQWEFIQPAVDFLGRFETLETDIQKLLDLPKPPSLPFRNRVIHNTFPEYYKQQSLVDRVRSIYAKDFELFGYSEDPLNPFPEK